MAKKGTSKRRLKHAFRFRVGGSGKILTHWARVIPGKRDVYLPLKAEHVRKSIELKGAGNTQTCSMAVCALANSDCFPHKVEGYIDWFYRRAYVVSRLDKNGIPSECYAYAHRDGIGQMNDTPGGQRKLLHELEESGGERIIHLHPIRETDNSQRSPAAGRKDGSRTKVQPRGAKLRFAVAELGGVPA